MSAQDSDMNWTKPFYGVTHCGQLCDRYSLTVAAQGDRAELSMWTRGDGFSPLHMCFDSVDEAKRAGEAWLRSRGIA